MLSSLQNIWTIVEDLVSNNMVTDVGVSDVDTDVFIALYNWAKVFLTSLLLQVLQKKITGQTAHHSNQFNRLLRCASNFARILQR